MKSFILLFFLLFLNLSVGAADWNEVLFESSENGNLLKVKQALEKGAKITYDRCGKGKLRSLEVFAKQES